MDGWQEILGRLAGRRVLVLGLARSGQAAARWLARRGAQVTGVDRSADATLGAGLAADRVELVIGSEPVERLRGCDLLVLSPGVHLDHPMVLEAQRLGILVLGELELAARLLSAPMLAVTGTNGKSTTTALCAHLLRRAGHAVFAGGNLGEPLISSLEMPALDWAVVEVSSYQLEHLSQPGALVPSIAVWLNLTPDHLDRHRSIERYADCKRRLFEGQGSRESGIFFADDPEVFSRAQGLCCRRRFFGREPRHLAAGDILIQGRTLLAVGQDARWHLPDDRLLGDHNAENAAAAVLATREAGLPPDAIQQGLLDFVGLPHRLELVAERDGVRYVNDSKGTNVDSVVRSLSSFGASSIVWIAGGRGKGAPYTPLRPLIQAHVRHMILLGEDAERMERELAGSAACSRVEDLAGAVALARRLARPGEVVLLSPACASFDMFRDFEERGEVFRRLVLAGGEGA